MVPFTEVGSQTWDSWLVGLQTATYLHSSLFLEYLHHCVPEAGRRSFALLDEKGEPLALCPLGISSVRIGLRDLKEGSWGGYPIAYPAMRVENATLRRRLARSVFEVVHRLTDEAGLARVTFRLHPLSLRCMRGDLRPINTMEAMCQGYACHPQNTVIIDLSISVGDLEARMTQYHRKRIRKSERQGISVRAFQGLAPGTKEALAGYQQAHFISSGRRTRPQKTFDLMSDYAHEGRAALFVAYVRETPISYLYCGQFDRMAFGWSQANLAEFEREYSPRHILEWEAVKWYKSQGYLYYDVGLRLYGPQPYKVPTDKEISISDLKERSGGDLWPDLCFERFFEKQAYEEMMRERQAQFLSSSYFPTSPNLGD